MQRKYGEHSFENLYKLQFPCTGRYGIPQILPNSFSGCSTWLPFNYLQSSNGSRENMGLHFFVDDYQFSRVWITPDRYAKLLTPFAAVCSPDFSLYTDMPVALQVYNHYRKHWLGAYWQLHGMQVIPTIAWSTPESFNWCFDGEPTHTTVAVSSIGCMKNPIFRSRFIDGYREMVDRLQPTQVLIMGQIPAEVSELAPTVTIDSFTKRFEGGG